MTGAADGGSQGAVDEEDLDVGPTKRRRRGKAVKKSVADLQAEWAWLAEMKREDQPWLFFALYKAYESQVHSDAALCTSFTKWLVPP
jgi:hypothetical protein